MTSYLADHEHSLTFSDGSVSRCDLCSTPFDRGYRCRVTSACTLAACSTCYNRALRKQMPLRRRGGLPVNLDADAMITTAITSGVTALLRAPLDFCFTHTLLSVVSDCPSWPRGLVRAKGGGIFRTARHIMYQHDVSAFFRGTPATLLGVLPAEAIEQATKDAIRDALRGDRKAGYARWLLGAVLYGGIGSALGLLLAHPLDLAHTLVRLDPGASHFSGVFSCMRETVAAHGVSALYAGLGVRVASRLLYRAVYFALYDATQNIMPIRDTAADARDGQFMRGFAVTFLAEATVHPLEVVARGVMATQLPALAVAKHVYSAHGASGFAAGMGQRFVEGLLGLGIMAVVGFVRHRIRSNEVMPPHK